MTAHTMTPRPSGPIRALIRGAAAAALTALALTGCGHATAPAAAPAHRAPVTAKPAVATAPPATPAVTGTIPAYFPEPAVPAGASIAPLVAHQVGQYGPAQVQQAYQQVAEFSLKSTFDPLVLTTDSKVITPAMMAWVKNWMSPVAAKSWDASVAKRSTDQGAADLSILDTYGATSNHYQVRKDVPQMTLHAAVTQPQVGRDTDARLTITVRVRGDVRAFDPHGKPILMHANKVVTYYLADAPGGHGFVIDGWQGNFYGSQPTPDAAH